MILLILIVVFNFNIEVFLPNTTFIAMISCNAGSHTERNTKCTYDDTSLLFLAVYLV